MLEDSMQRRLLRRKMVNSSYSQSHMEGLSCLEGIEVSEKSAKMIRGDSDGSQPIDATMDDREARNNDFCRSKGIFFTRHHVEPRVQVYVSKAESFPIPLRYIDVIRRTHTTLDVLQESHLDDFWNIDVDRNLSEPWTGFTQFTILI